MSEQEDDGGQAFQLTLDREAEDRSLRQQEAEESRLAASGWPYALIKAVSDPFTYLVRLRDGTEIIFGSAASQDSELWVTLMEVSDCPPLRARSHFSMRRDTERGIEVRVSEIVLAQDAPFGS